MKISVCIPTYNNAETLERCLTSVLAQDHPDFEVLLVDDASADDGVQIARSMLREQDRVIVNSDRLGAAGNHNRCIELARSELIQFVHGDDELLPGALSALAKTFDEDDVVFCFAPRRLVVDDEHRRRSIGSLHHHFPTLDAVNDGGDLITHYLFKGALSNWFGEPTSVMFRRDRAVEVGCFRADLKQIFDYDLWVRMGASHRIAFLDRELSVRHHDLTTLSEQNRREHREWLDRSHFMWSLAYNPEVPARGRLWALMWQVSGYPLFISDAIKWGGSGNRLGRVAQAMTVPAVEWRRARRLRRESV